jgi:hypothetical protein
MLCRFYKIKGVTIFRIRGHQNIFEALSNLRLGSGCQALLWYSFRIRSREAISLGKQISSVAKRVKAHVVRGSVVAIR